MLLPPKPKQVYTGMQFQNTTHARVLMNLAGMIFDLDGTLADTLPVCFAAYRLVLRRWLGQHRTDEQICALFGPNEEGIIRGLVPGQWQAALAAYLAEYERLHAEHNCSFAGIEDMLRLLHKHGIRLAIVTGKGPASADISLRHLGLAPYFQRVETGSSAGPIKPGSLRRILAAWNLTPHQLAYVGDSPSDMDAAREVGVLPLGATWAATSTLRNAPDVAAYTGFATVADLVDWIQAQLDY